MINAMKEFRCQFTVPCTLMLSRISLGTNISTSITLIIRLCSGTFVSMVLGLRSLKMSTL